MERHEPQFTGCFLPAAIMHLFWDGTISAKECMLLATIDSLVRNGPCGESVGCFASNEYLATKIHIKDANMVRKMIAKFKKMNLVRQVDFDGRKRYLETWWSRVRKSSEQDVEE